MFVNDGLNTRWRRINFSASIYILLPVAFLASLAPKPIRLARYTPSEFERLNTGGSY